MTPKEKAQELYERFGSYRLAMNVAVEVLRSQPTHPFVFGDADWEARMASANTFWTNVLKELLDQTPMP